MRHRPIQSSRFFLKTRHAFTLIELLIVGALIVLFSGLAIINWQSYYDDAKRKAMFSEAKQLATTLSFVRDDLGYYPRICFLDRPLSLITFNVAGQTALRPGFDTYGQFPAFTGAVTGVLNSWRGPYDSLSENRIGTGMFVRMRLTDQSLQSFQPTINTEDMRVVLWPSDKDGNPWMHYCVVADSTVANPANNPLGLRLIVSPDENPSYLNAVVTYGKNGVPGGGPDTQANDPNYFNNVLSKAMLYVKGDVAGGTAQFSLKSFTSSFSQTLIDPNTFNQFLAQSIKSLSTNVLDAGMRDTGSDDQLINVN